MDQSGQAPIVVRPMGVGEVIDAGIRLARQYFRPLVLLMAWGVVPSFVLGVIGSAAGFGSAQTMANAIGRTPGVFALYVILELVIVFVTVVASMAAVLACSRIVEGRVSPFDLSASALFPIAFRRLGWLILLGIIGVLLFIPLFVIFPLGIYLGVRWSAAYVALVVEGLGPFRALGRSWALTMGSWWHTLGVMIVAAILLAVLEGVVGGIFGAIGVIFIATGSPFVGGVLSNLGGALITLLITPFSVAIYVVLYYELRARREGFDLAMQASRLPET